MGKITVVGLGPGDIGLLTMEAWQRLTGTSQLYLRTEVHPVVSQLKEEGIVYQSFDYIYEKETSFDQVYQQIVSHLLSVAAESSLVYAVPGHPLVAETTVTMLLDKAKADLPVEIVAGMSFLDPCFSLLQIDPAKGLVVHDGLVLKGEDLVPEKSQIICQVYNQMIASQVKLTLMERFPDDYLITIVTAAGVPQLEEKRTIPLYELDRLKGLSYLTSVYVPPNQAGGFRPNSLEPIVQVMTRLRAEDGCPWDREQDHQSLKKFLIEEAYEVAEAIDENNMYKLCDELGDLLLQIVFHAQIAWENQDFNIDDVVATITEKMIRRHPHVFSHAVANTKEEVLKNWDAIKKQEKGEGDAQEYSILSVPRELPALMKSQKLQQQAAKVGFDWPDIKGVLDKYAEEWSELKRALAGGQAEEIKEEFGDVLFALVNLARFLKIDSEEVLQMTCNKFTKRFRFMEARAKEKEVNLTSLNLQQLENMWQEAKKCQNKGKYIENI